MQPKICEYGCGQVAKHQFKNGKWCCGSHYTQCPIEKEKCRVRNSGKNSHRYGVNHSRKTRILMHNSHKKYWKYITEFDKDKHKRKKDSIKQLKEKYPIFAKIEGMRYNPDKLDEKEIQVHCKNHLCSNSEEQNGWFTPKNIDQFHNRIYAIEHNTSESYYYYCSDECKFSCPLFGKTVNQLIKQDQINAGYIKKPLYTTEEYQTWRITILIRENYKCEYCDEIATDVHHSRPQKLEPGFVLDPDFGIACCEKHHYQYGHKKGTECSTGNLANKKC